MPSCNKNLPAIHIDLVYEMAESLIASQSQKAMFVQSPHFKFGKRSSTRYLEKSLSQMASCATRLVNGGFQKCEPTAELVNLLIEQRISRERRQQLMEYVDVGYRLSDDTLSVPNVLFNLMIYGQGLRSDWQFYLMGTPVGLSMMWDVINRAEYGPEFFKMLTHASVMGVTATDILVSVPSMGITICDTEGYLSIAANFAAKRAVYEVLTRGPGAVAKASNSATVRGVVERLRAQGL